uniref:Putative secreted protein n=1 Tax=Anopheles marajoara TaxID=58244 RepID=A0A2M4CA60_9DIPT
MSARAIARLLILGLVYWYLEILDGWCPQSTDHNRVEEEWLAWSTGWTELCEKNARKSARKCDLVAGAAPLECCCCCHRSSKALVSLV